LLKLIKEGRRIWYLALETVDMIDHALHFYNKLFGKEEKPNISLDSDFWEDSDKVSEEENLLMEADFSEEEILQAMKGSYLEGAPWIFFLILSEFLVHH
jgi:hypothetical protein